MPKNQKYGGNSKNTEGPNSPGVSNSNKSNHENKEAGGKIPSKGPGVNKMFSKSFKGTTS